MGGDAVIGNAGAGEAEDIDGARASKRSVGSRSAIVVCRLLCERSSSFVDGGSEERERTNEAEKAVSKERGKLNTRAPRLYILLCIECL
jgi:hypothetical protein